MLMTNERPPAIRRCADRRSRCCMKQAPSANARSTAGYDAKLAGPLAGHRTAAAVARDVPPAQPGSLAWAS
jgi:hypothetical protein